MFVIGEGFGVRSPKALKVWICLLRTFNAQGSALMSFLSNDDDDDDIGDVDDDISMMTIMMMMLMLMLMMMLMMIMMLMIC